MKILRDIVVLLEFKEKMFSVFFLVFDALLLDQKTPWTVVMISSEHPLKKKRVACPILKGALATVI